MCALIPIASAKAVDADQSIEIMRQSLFSRITVATNQVPHCLRYARFYSYFLMLYIEPYVKMTFYIVYLHRPSSPSRTQQWTDVL